MYLYAAKDYFGCCWFGQVMSLCIVACLECCTFFCSAGSGGALYIDSSTGAHVTLTNITNTLLKRNRAAQALSDADGGAIYLAGGISTTYNTTFADNHADRYGGAAAYRHQCPDFASLPGMIVQHCAVHESGV